MLKKIIIISLFLSAFIIPGSVKAQENEVNLYLFWSKTCPHCTKEKAFLEKVTPQYPYLKIYKFEISDRKNALLMQKVGKELKIDTSGVPLTLIGDYHLTGYLNDEISGKEIIGQIEELRDTGDPDTVGTILKGEGINLTEGNSPTATPPRTKNAITFGADKNLPDQIPLPFIGSINPKNVSLPVLTVAIAAVDGFNPCAMWTLLFLISLLIGMNDRKRMWILGSTFIFASALVYFLFLSAWLSLFLFLGFIIWVRLLIGVLALGVGGYYLREYAVNKDGSCKVTGGDKRQYVLNYLKSITQRKELYMALIGIILLAFAVNLVELICSAGLPAIYTQILSLADLARWQYYLYLLLYILVFMLDDLFIFFVAMFTLKITGIQSKYSRYSHLIGGILMIIIGLLMLFKPEWLMFT